MALLTSEFARLSHNCTGSHEGCRWFSRDPNHVSQGILTLHNDASPSSFAVLHATLDSGFMRLGLIS